MPPHRHAARRARHRRVRVVSLTRTAPVTWAEAYAWNTALEGLRLIHAHFPAFYQAHVAELPCTPPRLLGIALAFLRLVETERGLILNWDASPDLEEVMWQAATTPAAAPVEMLTGFDAVDPWFFTEPVAYFINGPQPCHYGYGVVALFDGYDVAVEPLAVLLWHMFHLTGFNLELDLDTITVDDSSPDLTAHIRAQQPLAPDAPAAQIAHELATSLPEARGLERPIDLILYPFGETSNRLANLTDHEIHAIYDDETAHDWDWSQIDRVIALQQEARALGQRWQQWSRRIAGDARAITRLARQLRRIERRVAGDAAANDGRLIHLLADSHVPGMTAREAYEDRIDLDWEGVEQL